MIKKLVKTGSSYALIIDKSIMELLNITPETPLEVTTDGKGLKVTPQIMREEVKKAFSESLKDNSELYKKLA